MPFGRIFMVASNFRRLVGNTMWLPTPVYERIPQFWLLLGLLFMSLGTYLGFEYSVSFLYFAVGFVCVGWSFCVSVMRSINRRNPHVVEKPTEQPVERPSVQSSEQPDFG
jgi:hypothetical protein